MKLIFLVILFCGITSAPAKKVVVAKTKTTCVCHQKAMAKQTRTSGLDIVPPGLLFQF